MSLWDGREEGRGELNVLEGTACPRRLNFMLGMSWYGNVGLEFRIQNASAVFLGFVFGSCL